MGWVVDPGDSVFDWDDLKLVLAAHRAKSFGRAAQQLGVSVSTMSRRIEALEEQLGVVLFARTPDGLVTESAATEILEHALVIEQAAARVDAAARASRSRASEVVRIASPPDFSKVVMPEVLARLFAAHPDASIELVEGVELSDMPRRAADIALRASRPDQGNDLVVTRLRAIELGVYASRRYLESVAQPIDPVALRWVLWSHPGAARSDWPAAQIGEVASVLRCSDPTTARLAIAAGVGVGLVPRFFARVTAGLEEVELGLTQPPSMTLWAVGHSAVLALPGVRRVWEFVVGMLRDGDEGELVGRLPGVGR